MRNAYATYGVALFALIYTGYELATGSLTWRWNWPLWNTMSWSDAALASYFVGGMIAAIGGIALLRRHRRAILGLPAAPSSGASTPGSASRQFFLDPVYDDAHPGRNDRPD